MLNKKVINIMPKKSKINIIIVATTFFDIFLQLKLVNKKRLDRKLNRYFY